jgi:hypothetical protein
MRNKLLLSGSLLIIALLLVPGFVSVERAATPATQSGPQVYDVVAPVGRTTIKQITQVRRLDTLAGKTIGLVSNNGFKSWVTMPLIQKLLAEKYPTAKFIPPNELPAAETYPAPGTTTKDLDAFRAAVKAKHIDAIITGNGG